MKYEKLEVRDEQKTAISLSRMVDVSDTVIRICGDNVAACRTTGKFAGTAIYLDDSIYDYVLGEDDVGMLILVPLKKDKIKLDK